LSEEALGWLYCARLQWKTGETLWIDQTKWIVRDSQAFVEEYRSSVRDITERKRVEKECELLGIQLHMRNEELEQALNNLWQIQGQLVQPEEMASIGQLTAGI
jgi:C4-dicarboxylate-specific signal transduction histidine kinase